MHFILFRKRIVHVNRAFFIDYKNLFQTGWPGGQRPSWPPRLLSSPRIRMSPSPWPPTRIRMRRRDTCSKCSPQTPPWRRLQRRLKKTMWSWNVASRWKAAPKASTMSSFCRPWWRGQAVLVATVKTVAVIIANSTPPFRIVCSLYRQ